jgi:Tol biopolymer transport system component/C-terminal processing protease CtpA/Prc
MKKIILLSALLMVFHAKSQNTSSPLWLRYPAISPDGSQICFSFRGDLWLVAAGGGEAKMLTSHIATDRQPVWSADGKMIAFASDRHGNFDVFVISAKGGEPQRLTYHSAQELPSAFSSDGSRVYFYATRLDDAKNAQFPSGALPETYSISISGGHPATEISTGSQLARPSSDGKTFIYQDRKGYEDEYRKHHASSVTRDIWLYDVKQATHRKISTFEGEDREPVWGKDDKEIYYLSEKSGTLNIWRTTVTGNSTEQMTTLKEHPVRHLSIAKNGMLCFGYDGEIYTLRAGEKEPQKVNIQIQSDNRQNERIYKTYSSQATEMVVSPNAKEIAFVVRGEIFVVSTEFETTKRITDTPEQERNISFSPDGRSILYAAERMRADGTANWDLYRSTIEKRDEPYFFTASKIKEETVLTGNAEEFQPAYSPDGSEIAYLEDRVKLKILHLGSGKTRTVLDSIYNYSYSDGDQNYHWSPDGKYLLVDFIDKGRWASEIGLVAADGLSKPVNLTQSGYSDERALWMQKGKSAIWFSDRYGMRSHGGWGSQTDVLAMFFSQEALDEFNLSRQEFELKKQIDKSRKKSEEKGNDNKKDGKKSSEKEKEDELPLGWVKPEKAEPLNPITEGIEFRTKRLTLHSSALADAYLTPDGSKLYYLSAFEKGFDLWVHKIRENETKLLAKLGENSGSIMPGSDGKLYILGGGKILQADTAKGSVKTIPFKAEMTVSPEEERTYMFEHAWRQTLKKFYMQDMHGVDWRKYKAEYGKFLPYISNGHDFADVLSEMLGELNASHTGARFGIPYDDAITEQTACLGLFYDTRFEGPGLRVTEVLKRSPFDNATSKVGPGTTIEKIDGESLDGKRDWAALLNRKAGKPILIEGKTKGGEVFSEIIKPISAGEEQELKYQRWLLKCRETVEKKSGGKIGYVHVRAMNDASFREVYSEALGRMNDKQAIIIDTRFNGGGWLHDDIATLFSGKQYVTFRPRGQFIGSEPQGKWQRKSLMLISESNYSDAHFTPYVYKQLGIGKLLGMPVPGTATAVWWETMIDGTVFGIPQVGVMGQDGKYLENTQLEPDIKVDNSYEKLTIGVDEQLEKAVEELMKP